MNKRSLIAVAVAAGVGLLCASSGNAQNLIVNGSFDTDLSGWTSTANGTTTIAYDGDHGDPYPAGTGSAYLDRNDSTDSDNGNYLYQIIPVTQGAQYKLDAVWQGDLLNIFKGGTGRNWAEVYVNTASTTEFSEGSILYKKASDGGPNDDPMPWTWESILLSPDGGPADGILTAESDYISIAFNLGGRSQDRNNTQPGYYWVDNVSLTLVPEPSTFALLGLGGLGLLLGRRRG